MAVSLLSSPVSLIIPRLSALGVQLSLTTALWCPSFLVLFRHLFYLPSHGNSWPCFCAGSRAFNYCKTSNYWSYTDQLLIPECSAHSTVSRDLTLKKCAERSRYDWVLSTLNKFKHELENKANSRSVLNSSMQKWVLYLTSKNYLG